MWHAGSAGSRTPVARTTVPRAFPDLQIRPEHRYFAAHRAGRCRAASAERRKIRRGRTARALRSFCESAGGHGSAVLGVVSVFRQVFPEEFTPVERLVRRACERDSRPACRFRSGSRTHRHHRLRRPAMRCFSCNCSTVEIRSRYMRGALEFLLRPRPAPCAHEANARGRFRGPPETASRRAPLPGKPRAW